jgi:hypothetical protein
MMRARGAKYMWLSRMQGKVHIWIDAEQHRLVADRGCELK